MKRDWGVRLRSDTLASGLNLTYNGQVRNLNEARELIKQHQFDGVMLGRALMEDPFLLADKSCNRENVALDYAEWLQYGLNASSNAESANVAPILNLFHGQPGNKLWKRLLLEDRHDPSGPRIRQALAKIKSVV